MWKQILRKENPIMNFKKAFFCASFGLLGASVLSLCFFNTRAVKASALNQRQVAEDVARYDSSSFPGETELSQDDLKVKVTSSTKTSMGQSFTFYFTTGGEGYQDGTKTFLIAPNDSGFEKYFTEVFSKYTSEEKDEIERAYERGEYETVKFIGQLFTINQQEGYTSVYVPATFSRGIFYQFKITEIVSDALTLAQVEKGNGIQSVYIPNTIDTIYEDSFPEGLPANFEFNVEFEENEVPPTWDPAWNHGAKVNYGVEIAKKNREVKQSGASISYGDKEKHYMIGYYPKNDQQVPAEYSQQYPLVLSYSLVGSNEIKFFEFSKSTTSSIGSYFDAVGYRLGGYDNTLQADIRIDLAKDEEIDFESIRVHNIFPAVQEVVNEKKVWIPQTNSPLYSNPAKSFSKTLSIDDLIKYSFKGISTFGGYTSVDLNVDQAGDELFSELKSSFVKQYATELKSGKMYIRYRFTSFNSCSYDLTYKNGGQDVRRVIPVKTIVNQHILTQKKGNFVSFLFKNSDVGQGFSAKSIRQFSFISFYVTLDMFDSNSGIVARTDVVSRFGFFMVMPYTSNAEVFDIDLMLILMSAGYVALYAVLAVAAFFYFKNKFKNDEFRRVKPKSFWIKAVLGLFGSLVVILCITFIVLRTTAFNNSIVVYNPVDAYIIISAVASVLIIGYFIKYIVTMTKANKERKRVLKLKLNEDVEDDGTK